MKKKLLALLVSSAFLFAACGDDDSPSSPENEKEISSSSEEFCDSDECDVKSSSSKAKDKKSSSSKKSKSSSSKGSKSSSSVKNSGKSSSSTAKDKKSSSSEAKDEKSSSSVAKDETFSSSVANVETSSSSVANAETSSSSVAKDETSSSSVAKDETSSSSVANVETSSSSVANVETSSSSVANVETSSSSVANVETSSSSVKIEPESSSSVADLNEDRAATLEELEKYMKIEELNPKLLLSIGSRQGIFSLCISDELWIVTYSDFENGEVEFKEGSLGIQYTSTEAAMNIIRKTKEGIKISFKVDKNSVVKYSINGSDYTNVVKDKNSIAPNQISKAENIMNKVYTCTDDDATKVFKFFDNTYILESIAEGKTVSQENGYYDIHRGVLLLYNTNYDVLTSSLSTYSIYKDNTIVTKDNKRMNCTVD